MTSILSTCIINLTVIRASAYTSAEPLSLKQNGVKTFTCTSVSPRFAHCAPVFHKCSMCSNIAYCPAKGHLCFLVHSCLYSCDIFLHAVHSSARCPQNRISFLMVAEGGSLSSLLVDTSLQTCIRLQSSADKNLASKSQQKRVDSSSWPSSRVDQLNSIAAAM